MSFTNDVLADVADVLEVQPFACPSCQKDIERKVMQVHGIQGIEEGSVLAQVYTVESVFCSGFAYSCHAL
eukprot:m.96204 g.96204  ORF g.96204 m.96204 type:complete len:70 (-) comp15044_c0_seq8:794-1003(-)